MVVVDWLVVGWEYFPDFDASVHGQCSVAHLDFIFVVGTVDHDLVAVFRGTLHQVPDPGRVEVAVIVPFSGRVIFRRHSCFNESSIRLGGVTRSVWRHHPASNCSVTCSWTEEKRGRLRYKDNQMQLPFL